MNDKLRKEFKKPTLNKDFVKNPLKKDKDTVVPSDEENLVSLDSELNETRRKTREAQQALQKKKDEIQRKVEANKKLMQATMKLNKFQKLMLSPVRADGE